MIVEKTKQVTKLDEVRVNFGQILQAAVRALYSPRPAYGELSNEIMYDEYEIRHLGQSMTIKLNLKGSCTAKNVECNMPDASTLVFPRLEITKVTFEATIIPVVNERGHEFFNVKKPDCEEPIIAVAIDQKELSDAHPH